MSVLCDRMNAKKEKKNYLKSCIIWRAQWKNDTSASIFETHLYCQIKSLILLVSKSWYHRLCDFCFIFILWMFLNISAFPIFTKCRFSNHTFRVEIFTHSTKHNFQKNYLPSVKYWIPRFEVTARYQNYIWKKEEHISHAPID